MKKNVLITLLAALLLSSCGEYNKLLQSTDYEYKYEAAKNYFAKGQYSRAATLLNELIAILQGTDKAEESLYSLGMSYYNPVSYTHLDVYKRQLSQRTGVWNRNVKEGLSCKSFTASPA